MHRGEIVHLPLRGTPKGSPSRAGGARGLAGQWGAPSRRHSSRDNPIPPPAPATNRHQAIGISSSSNTALMLEWYNKPR